MTRGLFRPFWLLAALALVAAMAVHPVRAQGGGHWELAHSQNQLSEYSAGNGAGLFAGRNIRVDVKASGTSSDGSLNARFDCSYRDAQGNPANQQLTASVNWAPPPASAAPGQRWDPSLQVTRPADRSFTAGISVYYGFTDQMKPNSNLEALYDFRDPARGCEIPGTFGPDRPYMFIMVRPSAGSNSFVCDVSDRYYYFYRWVEGAARSTQGNLRVIVRSSEPGAVEGARCIMQAVGAPAPVEETTDGQGECKRLFGATGSSLEVAVTRLILTSATRFHVPLERPVPSYLVPNAQVAWATRAVSVLSDRNNFFDTVEVEVPVFRCSVLALIWNEGQDRWVPSRVRVQARPLRAAQPMFDVPVDAFRDVPGGGPGLALRFPTREVLGHSRLEVLGYDSASKWKDMKVLAVPTRAAARTASLTLLLCDAAMRLARLRQDLYEYFRPLVGDAMARRIADLQIRMGGNRPNYLDGVMTIPATLDLTKDEFAEMLMHEWGHHITEVAFPDPGVEDRVGGAHDTWTVSGTPELAWDEGRAHFFAVVLTRGLGLPNNPESFGRTAGLPQAQGRPQAGDRVEGVIGSALVDYYTSCGFTKGSQVMRDFLQTHDRARQASGNPPRTSGDFFRNQRDYIQQQISRSGRDAPAWRRRMDQLDRVVNQYGISL